MAHETILLELRGPVATVTLNRPEKANAINSTMRAELRQVFTELPSGGDTRAVIITGAGRHFCAGVDLGAGLGEPGYDGLADFVESIAACPLPVIAAINGAAMGGGCEIALACDLRFIADTASIGLPEIRFGLLPLLGGTQRLPRLVGPAVAKEMLLTGLPLDAAAARACGLVSRVTSPEALLSACGELALLLASRAPYAVAACLRLVDEGLDLALGDALKLEEQVTREMGTPAERAAARGGAAAADPTYARIFARDEGSATGTSR